MAPERRFVLFAHTVPPDGAIHLNDLAGTSGRIDVTTRAVTSAFLLSHDVRKDTRMTIVVGGDEGALAGPDFPAGRSAPHAAAGTGSSAEGAQVGTTAAAGARAQASAASSGPSLRKLLRIDGSRLKMLNPDERSTAALLAKALAREDSGRVWMEASPGLEVRHAPLDEALREATEGSRPILLDESGTAEAAEEAPHWARETAVTFLLSDHRDLTPEERAAVAALEPRRVTLGPTAYHGHACIAVVHWLLDGLGQQPKSRRHR